MGRRKKILSINNKCILIRNAVQMMAFPKTESIWDWAASLRPWERCLWYYGKDFADRLKREEECVFLRHDFRIYLNAAQLEQDRINADCARFVHNYYLGKRSLAWKCQHRSISATECKKDLTWLKKVFPWLNAADATVLQDAIETLDAAFTNFFEHRAGYPQFRSRKASGHSYATKNNNASSDKPSIRIEGRHIILPKMGKVRIRLSQDIAGEITSATIVKKPSGKYFVSLCVRHGVSDVTGINGGEEHGLDLGLRDLYILDDGTKSGNPKWIRRAERKLARAQKKLSRMVKGSSGYKKQRAKVARLHEKVANCRKDFLHKASSALAKRCSLLCVEDLNIKGLMKNHHLAKAIADAGWGMFIQFLEYKMDLRGGCLLKVPRFFASSQTCSSCGYRNPKTKDPSVREWTCPECGEYHDCDVNAARNMLAKGRELLDEYCSEVFEAAA